MAWQYLGAAKKRYENMKPVEIILEVTNYCNLRCRYCHIHGKGAGFGRPKGYMAPELWKDILRELSQWTEPVHLVTHGAGEPLLYPHLKELLLEAKKLPHLTVGFMTNGMLLSPEMSRFLVENQIDWLAFSIDGVRSETHDSVRLGASLQLIEQNVEYLAAYKAKCGVTKPHLKFNMVLYPHIKDQKDAFLKRWLPYAHCIFFSRFRPVGSKKLWDQMSPPVAFKPCHLLFTQAAVSWQGRLALCCEDIETEISPGDISNQSLSRIFESSPVLKLYREKHRSGDTGTLKLCKDCHVWAAPICLEERTYIENGHSIHYRKTPAAETYEIEKNHD